MLSLTLSCLPSADNTSKPFIPRHPSTSRRPLTTPKSLLFPSHSKNKAIKASSLPISISAEEEQEDGSAEKFLGNNSITDFMRFKKGPDKSSGLLQTAVVSHRKRFPWFLLYPFFRIDLVSTIHIADKEYFTTLQKELEAYDCVLYEMVASRESLESRRNPTAAKRLKNSHTRGLNIIGCIQRQMAQILTLDFQLDCLDYQGQNWHHADLDYETFKLLQLEKGESFLTFARDMTLRSTKAIVQSASIREDLDPWRSKLLWASRVLPMPFVGLFIIGSVCDAGGHGSKYPELEALSRLDFAAAMKVFLAKRLTTEFTQVTPYVGEKTVIIGERNRAAIEALRRALDDGHNRIAILYGGGHMPDLGRRLHEEFDLIPSSVRWITAWSIRNRHLKTDSFPFLKTMAKVFGWPLNRYQTLALLIFSIVLAVDLWFWELFFGTMLNVVSQIALEASKFVDNIQRTM